MSSTGKRALGTDVMQDTSAQGIDAALFTT